MIYFQINKTSLIFHLFTRMKFSNAIFSHYPISPIWLNPHPRSILPNFHELLFSTETLRQSSITIDVRRDKHMNYAILACRPSGIDQILPFNRQANEFLLSGLILHNQISAFSITPNKIHIFSMVPKGYEF